MLGFFAHVLTNTCSRCKGKLVCLHLWPSSMLLVVGSGHDADARQTVTGMQSHLLDCRGGIAAHSTLPLGCGRRCCCCGVGDQSPSTADSRL